MEYFLLLAILSAPCAVFYYYANNLHNYDKSYDTLLNHLMDKDIPITTSYLTAKFKDIDLQIWIGNYPYSYGNTYPNSTVFPSMKTRKRLASYIIQHQVVKP